MFKYLILIFLSGLLSFCGSNSGQKKNNFIIKTNADKGNIATNDTLKLSIENKTTYPIDSVSYTLKGKHIGDHLSLSTFKLGKQTIEATVFFNNEKQVITSNITVLNSEPPKIYTYKIINEYPHDISSYTQGLEFYKDTLYESTGQKGESKLIKVDYKTGEVYNSVHLADDYFGEGLTILNNKIYQLTWRGDTGFIYDANTFDKVDTFKYGKSKEGWGLCNDNQVIYKSDGTENIWLLNPDTLVEEDHIEVFTNKGKIIEINEMEWIDGKIYANRYQKDGVAIINPINGAVIAVIDFSPLKERITRNQGWDNLNNVLNGIAYNPKTKTIFVTGKRWDKLFEVEIIEN